MLKRIFESLCELLQALILVQLLFAAAVAITVVVYFVVMSAFRIVQMTWAHVFSRPFP